MSSSSPEPAAVASPVARRTMLLGTIAFAGVTVAALMWAKWYPYWLKIPAVADSHSVGTSILTGDDAAPPGPSWRAAVDYAVAYGLAIWPALVAGLLLSASVQALLPARRLMALFQRDRGRAASTIAGGLLAMPSMMCTCCAAPVTIGIRRRGVPISSALAFQLGNPVLNPAALIFMAIVLPWQFLTVRVVTGVALVFGVTMLVGRLVGARRTVADPQADRAGSGEADEPTSVADAGRRFVAALGRLSVTLLPEYLVIVLLLGGLRGWLFPVAHGIAGWGVLAVLLFAVVGTLFVIPTAGEIPIIQGLMVAGIGLGPVGALVVTLPALSLPSLVMVRRVFPSRVIAATGLSVAGIGLVGAALLVVLS